MKMEGIDAEVYEHGAKLLGHIIPPELFNEIVALRRKLHELPELAFEERSTAAVVREELRLIEGVRVLATPAGGTGVIAVIKGRLRTRTFNKDSMGVSYQVFKIKFLVGGVEGTGKTKTILFRADLDGLPIQEVLEVPRPDRGGSATRTRMKHTW